MSAVIEISEVRKRYGDVTAVAGVSLAIDKGEFFGLIGHNGAGKSTLFKMMLGLVPATQGEIRINGSLVSGGGFREVRRAIGYLPENVVLWDNLSGLETLRFFAGLKNAPQNQCAGLLEKVGLSGAANRQVRGYSKGMRQRLGLAQALLGKPKILFLDEPTTGLDPEGIHEFYRILRVLRDEESVTMVLTSHILAEIQERVDRLAIMRNGVIQAEGTVRALREGMNLPIWIEARPADGMTDAVLAAMQALAPDEIRTSDRLISARCIRPRKMAYLSALAMLDGKVEDVTVREPSLEDIFLGYGD